MPSIDGLSIGSFTGVQREGSLIATVVAKRERLCRLNVSHVCTCVLLIALLQIVVSTIGRFARVGVCIRLLVSPEFPYV